MVRQDVLLFGTYFFLAGVAAAGLAWAIAYVITVLRLHHVTDGPHTRGLEAGVRGIAIAIGLNDASVGDEHEGLFARLLRSSWASPIFFLFWLLIGPAMVLWAVDDQQSAFAWILAAATAVSAYRFFYLIKISETASIVTAVLAAVPISLFLYTVPEIAATVSSIVGVLQGYFAGLADAARLFLMIAPIVAAAGACWLASRSGELAARSAVAAIVLGCGVLTLLFGVADGHRVARALPYVGAALALVIVVLTYIVWRWDTLDRRNRLSASVARLDTTRGWRTHFGLNGEMVLATGILAALPLLSLARLDADYKIFENGSAEVYARHILDELVDALSLGDVTNWLIDSLGLQWKDAGSVSGAEPIVSNLPWFLHLMNSALVDFGWTIILALVAFGSVALYGRLVAARIQAFESRLRKVLANALTPTEDVFAEAQRAAWRGASYATAATGVADKVITAELATRNDTPQQPHSFESAHPPFLGYLLCAWQGGVQLRQRFLRTGLRLVGERLDRLLELVDPNITSHLAVSETRGLGELVSDLRATRAQWSPGSAPLNHAAMTNLLAIELSRIVEKRWRLDDPDQSELVALLAEAEALLQEAISVFEQTWSPADTAAVHHNLGTTQFLLALVRRDSSKLDQGIAHLENAQRARDPQTIGVFSQSADLIIDAAASHAYLALAHGQRAVWTGQDSHAFRAFHHAERATEIYGGESSRLLNARENHVASLVIAGKLALTFAAWETAAHCFEQALSALPQTNMNRPEIVSSIRLRLAFAATRAALDTLAQSLFGQEARATMSLSILETAQRHLRRARTLIEKVSEPAQLRALIRLQARSRNTSRHDFVTRALLLAASAKCWVWNEFQLVQAAREERQSSDTEGARLAAEGLAFGDQWSSVPLLEGDKAGITDKNNAIVEADTVTVRGLIARLNRDWDE